MDSAPPNACIISSEIMSRSSSVMPMRRIISFTWGRPRSLAHFRHRPSLTVSPFSILEMKTTATRFLHLVQRVGCILFYLHDRRTMHQHMLFYLIRYTKITGR